MTILMISKDRTIMDEASPARARMEEFLGFCTHLHIIVLNAPGREVHVGTLSLYPARNPLWHLAPLSAVSIGKRIQKKTPFDVVATQDPFESGWVGKVLSKHLSVPLHVQVHTDLASPYFARSHWLNSIRLILSRDVLKSAQAIRTVSKRVKHGIMKKYPGIVEPSVLPIFVSHTSYENIVRRYPFPFTILMVSRLEKEKRISFALSVLAKLIKRYPALGVLIIGDGREKKALEKKARRLGIHARVLFEGWRDDVHEVYAQSHALFVTSGYEGYGRTYLEATDAGIPVVSTDVGLMGDVFINKESALVCDVEDEKCFVTAFSTLLNDLGLRHTLITHAQRAVAEHRQLALDYPRKAIEDIARARTV
jgi:glycosyltransferase involved in cell wall biosynthesis